MEPIRDSKKGGERGRKKKRKDASVMVHGAFGVPVLWIFLVVVKNEQKKK